MIDQLLIYCKLKAIDDRLNPTTETILKSFQRAYSKRFNTPLPQVEALDPEIVLQAIFDDKYEEMDLVEDIEEILTDIYRIENPDYDKQQQEGIKAFSKLVEEREKKRLKSALTKAETKKSGGVDFSKLKNEK
jgi:PBP1b-binding outer membrane lipoprotein LpoB